jgi:uncharacterized low-complexity protein
MSSNRKPVVIAVGAALAGGLALSASAFAINPLAQGYMLAASVAEGGCGGHKGKEGKCGEGRCGLEKMDTDKDGRVSRAEFAAAHGGKDDKFAAIDTNNDGFITAEELKAHKASKGKEGKCGGEKKTGEGKCGEGKCGAM